MEKLAERLKLEAYKIEMGMGTNHSRKGKIEVKEAKIMQRVQIADGGRDNEYIILIMLLEKINSFTEGEREKQKTFTTAIAEPIFYQSIYKELNILLERRRKLLFVPGKET